MANDDISLNRPAPSAVQSGQPVSRTSASPGTHSKSPRVDAGTGQVYGNTMNGSGPKLASPNAMTTTYMTMMLASLQEKISTERISSAKNEVQSQTEDAQAKDKKKIDDIKKSIEAKKKASHHSKLGKIFGWIGVALTYVAAVVVAVASGGAAAAPVLAAAVLMTGLMVAQETGGIDKLAKAMDLGKKGEMALMIGLTAAILVVSLVSVVASGGAAAVSMVSSIASAVTRATAAGAEIGAGAADMAAAGAETASAAAEISADATEAAAEGAEISADTEEITSATLDASSEAGEASSEMAETSSEVSETSSETTESSEEAGQSTSKANEAEEGAQKAKTGEDIAEKSASTTQRVAARVGNIVNLSSAGASVGSGAEGIQTSEADHDASMASADATDQQAFLAQIQALQAATIRKLRKILEDMQANTNTIFSIISTSNKMTEEISKGASA